MTHSEQILKAYQKHKDTAHVAFLQFREHCLGADIGRVPGMSTVIRLAGRIECGRTVEEAARCFSFALIPHKFLYIYFCHFPHSLT